MSVNLQKELEKIISKGGRPSLLLHSCCAPCSSYVLEYLSQYFNISLLYYNPNILPEEEYCKRLNELTHLVADLGLNNSIKIYSKEYNPDVFLQAVKGLEGEPEGGKRCAVCFELRLKEAALMAKNLGCDYFTTTLSISPHKDSKLLDEIALALEQEYGVKRLPSDFKKRGGYQRSVELSHKFGLYRQDWCGCPFSKAETIARRQKTENSEN